MDFSLYKSLNGFADRHDGFEDILRFFATDTPYLFAALFAVLFLARGKWRSVDGRRGVAAAGFSSLLALGVAQVISGAVDRARPYVAHPGDAHLFVSPPTDPSFPSDHSTAAFAIAVSIWLYNRKAGWLALALATLVTVGRVAVGAHYPADVLAGALLGTGAALLLWLPPMRDWVQAIADFAGRVYDAIADRVLGGSSAAGSQP